MGLNLTQPSISEGPKSIVVLASGNCASYHFAITALKLQQHFVPSGCYYVVSLSCFLQTKSGADIWHKDPSSSPNSEWVRLEEMENHTRFSALNQRQVAVPHFCCEVQRRQTTPNVLFEELDFCLHVTTYTPLRSSLSSAKVFFRLYLVFNIQCHSNPTTWLSWHNRSMFLRNPKQPQSFFLLCRRPWSTSNFLFFLKLVSNTAMISEWNLLYMSDQKVKSRVGGKLHYSHTE